MGILFYAETMGVPNYCCASEWDKESRMPSLNLGVCKKCRRRVPAEHVFRDGKVYIRKECPDCGTNESLISSDMTAWQHKRDVWRYDPAATGTCTLNCAGCAHDHHVGMVFLDVTNRCNMNCPICIANIPGMGFEFHPPMTYFKNVFAGLAAFKPPPTIQLFGGEPTVRDDLFEIIDLARAHGLRVRLVTNGLRLADEEYCRRLCETKVPVLLAFDGRDPEIYLRLRKSPNAYEKKLKALENLKRFSKRKNIIMCCVARKVNDRHMRDLINFCHENRDSIGALHMIPLTETWAPGEFETDVHTTIEDVERIVAEAFPGERVEFISAGIGVFLKRAMSFFGSPRLTFGGAHPNCESMTMLVSDGVQYRPVGHFLKRPIDEIAMQALVRAKKIDGRLARLSPGKWFQRWRGRLIVVRAFAGLVFSSLDFHRIAKGNPWWRGARILAALAIGRPAKDVFRKHTRIEQVLGMVVLPFEEYDATEGQRLVICPSGFAYEDPDDGRVKTIPVCTWSLYRNEIQRKIAAKYSAR